MSGVIYRVFVWLLVILYAVLMYVEVKLKQQGAQLEEDNATLAKKCTIVITPHADINLIFRRMSNPNIEQVICFESGLYIIDDFPTTKMPSLPVIY